MTLTSLLENKHLSRYRVAKMCDIPQSTLRDLCNGTTDIKKTSAEVVFKLSKALSISMEDLVQMDSKIISEKRMDFELYKSTVCHRVHDMGDIDFMLDVLKSNEIRVLYERKWYAESFYMLAMVDYLSRLHHIDLVKNYNDIRQQKLKETLYPASAWISYELRHDKTRFKLCEKEAIPEFRHFNIIESDIRNVI